MYTYKKIEKYDQKTGKLIGFDWEVNCVISDITGKKFDMEKNYTRYALKYGDVDPCYGCNEEEYQLKNKYKLNIFAFLDVSYAIEDAGIDLTQFPIFMDGLKKGFLDHALRLSRVHMTSLLLKGKIYTLEELFGPFIEG